MQPPEPPQIDTDAVARLYSALAGGIHTTAGDRARAADVEARAPGAADRIAAAREFHAQAAERAVARAGTRGLIIAEAGYPAWPDPHERALAVTPASARAVYCDAGEEVTDVNAEVFRADWRISACQASALAPEALLARPEVQVLPRPWCLLLCMAVHFWPPETAAAVIAGFGELLPSGSVLALSLSVPGLRPPGQPFGGPLAVAAGGQVHAHSPEAVAGWLEAAGMTVTDAGVQDVRCWPHPRWAEKELRERYRRPWRIIGAVARVP